MVEWKHNTVHCNELSGMESKPLDCDWLTIKRNHKTLDFDWMRGMKS